MFEFLFFVTAVYMGYVAYEAYQAVDRAEKGEPVFPAPAPQKESKAPPVVAAPEASKPVATPSKTVAAEKPAATQAKKPVKNTPVKQKAASKAESSKSAPSAKTVLSDNLKNPETGEVTSVPVNYRFAKKWIKDALVNEGLLDRVYKPNELDDATSKKVKDAIDKMRAMKKFQA